MSEAVIVNFELNLSLLIAGRNVTIVPSSYWGITVAGNKATASKFAGRTPEEMLALIEDSAATGTQEAVADNQQRNLDSPGTRDGQLVVLKPGGSLVTLKR